MKLFRIQSLKKESLWYDFDGNFRDKMKQITGEEVPMPYQKWRQEKGKLLSSVKDKNNLKKWFDNETLEKLFNSGYGFFEYDVDNCIYLPKGETVFDLEKINSVREIDMNEILKP